MSREYIINCVHKIAKNEGFIDYKIETNDGSNHGDNFVGVLIAASIIGTKKVNDKDEQNELHLFCKVPPAEEARRQMFQSTSVFEREIFVYSKILPAFSKFQREKGLNTADSFTAYPKIYYYNENMEKGDFILIMQNLKRDGFVMWPKEMKIPLDHDQKILHEIGKLHGVSFAMKDQQPHEFEKFKNLEEVGFPFIFNGQLRPFFIQCVERAVDVIKNPEHKKIMQKFHDRIEDNFKRCLCDPASKVFGVILHGDCWINNFMMKYYENDKKKLKEIFLLDWQIARYCSPALDVLHSIFTATDKPFRDQHYENLIKTYYSSLSETIRKLGSDPEKLFTFDDFQSELRKFSDYILLYGPLVYLLRLAKASNTENLNEYSERTENNEANNLINLDDESQIEFSRLVNELMTDLVNYGYVNNNAS